jgi:YebC/PmpR family DNA-binding regulatory protein
MAGHSKWANIKHKKGAADKKKAKIFSCITKEIIVAVKTSGPDVDTNARLRTAIIAAKAANMPNSNIERAIKKAAGDTDTSTYEEIVYEGYGPEGVAILVECLTDNRNRSGGEVRLIFDRTGGNMANSGAVTWMFHRKSRFVVTGENASEDKLLEIVIDAGAEDIEESEGMAEIWGAPDAFEQISNTLEVAGITPEEAGLARVPENYVEIKDAETAGKIMRLIEKLEDQDDVQAVYANFDISDEIIEELSEE